MFCLATPFTSGDWNACRISLQQRSSRVVQVRHAAWLCCVVLPAGLAAAPRRRVHAGCSRHRAGADQCHHAVDCMLLACSCPSPDVAGLHKVICTALAASCTVQQQGCDEVQHRLCPMRAWILHHVCSSRDWLITRVPWYAEMSQGVRWVARSAWNRHAWQCVLTQQKSWSTLFGNGGRPLGIPSRYEQQKLQPIRHQLVLLLLKRALGGFDNLCHHLNDRDQVTGRT
jgi:hypothetical protein